MKCKTCKKWCKYFFLLAAVVMIGIQFVPVDRSNPPSTGMINAPEEVMVVLHRSCFDCHSYETKWPWYAYVAPMSWLVTNDVKEARKHLNFSIWSEYIVKRQNFKRNEIGEEVEDGAMPLWKYVLLHPEAKLSQAEIDLIVAWSEADQVEKDPFEEDHEGHDHD